MSARRFLSVSALVFTTAVCAQTPITLDQAMAHPDWIGTPVEQAWWSADSGTVYYRQKLTGSPVRATYRVGADGASQRVENTGWAQLDEAQQSFDRSRQRAVFVRQGDVFLRQLGSNSLVQITRSAEAETNPVFGTDGSVLFQRGNDWFASRNGLIEPVLQLKTENDPKKTPPTSAASAHELRLIATLARQKAEREALNKDRDERRAADGSGAMPATYLGGKVDVSGSSLSPDGRYALVITTEKGADEGQAGKMPKYVTESGFEEFENVRTRVGRNMPLAQKLWLVDVRTQRVRELDLSILPGIAADPLAGLRKAQKLDPLKGNRAVRMEAPAVWSSDGSQVALMVRAVDNKDRWLVGVDFDGGKLNVRHRLTDPAWINWSFNEYGFLPDNRFWYLSEQSGYSHLYVGEGKAAKMLTSGNYEASSVQWDAAGTRAYFLCNRRWPGDYEVCRINRDGSDLREVTALDGVEDFSLSPDGKRLAVRYSGSYLPAQLALVDAGSGETRKLTDTRSAEFKARGWIEPEYVQVPSKHGAGVIWAKLYRPKNAEAGKKYPIAMFVHGAGYLQNVSARYPNYFREQMFHNLLVQQGYVVLDMDYRASEGYGRDWRTAIYRQMGHPELEDYLDGVDYMVAKHQGDRANVGIYGGSYGGFMSFMALFRAPDAFKAGAALRPVTDWTTYNHEYTANILNTPDIDPEAYRKSSPIEYVQNLKGALLISHGMMDDNVFYQDSVRLSQRLIEMKKGNWTMASYPLERHGYVQPESWYDQYRRIYELFEANLKAK
ncbi:S9 family peptidase [Arenimonas sp. GDDSR-1]|uniref:S9 family peptidase n=1 Tax=Arenimonas sp. GDDSR-1 TaxID=2950125 RepID=UPI00261D42F0|nr:S9 family peptidase [Arenimonas sp. GDDSR-1]